MYPGHFVKMGEPDPILVGTIQQALLRQGYGPFTKDGVFDDQMRSVVKLFQSQHVDRERRRLHPDGVVGPLTWAAIFGRDTSPKSIASSNSPLLAQTIKTARGELGVMEVPPGSNRGPRVDQYLESVGIDPNRGTADDRAWCMAFAYFCVNEAANALGAQNRLKATGRVLDQWQSCQEILAVRCITRKEAVIEPSLVRPGQLLIIDHGNGHGHTGLMEVVDAPHLDLIEGNVNEKPNDPEGVGVYRTQFRTLLDPEIVGFIDCDP
jgi:hypothetical protein